MNHNGGGFAAADLPGERRAGYGAAPPASRVATAIAARRVLRPALDPGASTAPHRAVAGGRGKAPARRTARRSRPSPTKQSLYGFRGLPLFLREQIPHFRARRIRQA
jgi:hypothetical protein